MKNVGVIAEYNPFHNGHLYHLNEVKKMFPNSNFILVLIGNFTQRGEVSIIDKWDKAKIALDYGYDLVVELPFLFATQAANIYAKGAIEILNYLNCDYLVFGSETNDVKLLERLVLLTHDNEKYEKLVKKAMDDGLNYPSACSFALNKVANVKINKPNDVLALEYVRRIKNTNSKIIAVSIKRTNDYHDQTIRGKITSATSIRKNLNNKKLIKNVMPSNVFNYVKKVDYDKYFNLLKYQINTSSNLNEYIGVDEGIENKLKKVINNVSSVDELIQKIKSKRYSYNRIQRTLLHVLCKNKKENNDLKIKYLRVLGLNNNGKKILKEAKKSNVPIITKFKKEYEPLFKEDIKASLVYSILTNYDVKKDYATSIIKK